MKIILCPSCAKPIEIDHAYKIVDGTASHTKCEAPMAEVRNGKTLSWVSSPGNGTRWDGIKQD